MIDSEKEFRFYEEEGVYREFVSVYDDEKISEALNITKERFPGVRCRIIDALKLYANQKNPNYRGAIFTSFSAVKMLLSKITGFEEPTRKQINIVYSNPKQGDLRKVSLLTLLEHVEREDGVRRNLTDEKLSESRLKTFVFIVACARVLRELIEDFFPEK